MTDYNHAYQQYDEEEILAELGACGYPVVRVWWNDEQSCWNVSAEGLAVTAGGDSFKEAIGSLWRHALNEV